MWLHTSKHTNCDTNSCPPLFIKFNYGFPSKLLPTNNSTVRCRFWAAGFATRACCLRRELGCYGNPGYRFAPNSGGKQSEEIKESLIRYCYFFAFIFTENKLGKKSEKTPENKIMKKKFKINGETTSSAGQHH
jgi:hypothetical protein